MSSHKRSQKLFLLTTIALMAVVLTACSKEREEPAVSVVTKVEESPNRNIVRPNGKRVADAKTAHVTVARSELSRSFLYGASLQTSSLMEDEIATSLLAIALGHVPAKLQIVGKNLQLVADQSISFESDMNHPDRLIHEFPIVRQNAKTITFRVERGSPTLSSVLFGTKAAPARTSWLRSTEYVKNNNLLMLETSVEAADGSVAEFMETLMPRDSLVPMNFEPIYNDPHLEPAAERFRFLDAGKVFIPSKEDRSVRIQTAIAQRFYLKTETDVIRWYVTRNIPEKYLGDIKAGIEGWNRYSQKMWARDFVKFEGLLPEGVKIGDPRYNIVVWDTVQDAGAAYESQASDPTTGIQSHSLIYLPLAWVNIGKAYWSNGQFSHGEDEKVNRLNNLLKERFFMGRALPIHCLEDATKQVSLSSRVDDETFARELLKGVLFHEMGHALGMAHNFKGSLAFDPEQEQPVFTSSVMDYNHYNEELAVFEGPQSSNGPLFEYDRQIISTLYNGGKDIKETDPVLPACNDEEADTRAGGVDPLCVRYDIGKNPIEQVQRMLNLVEKEDLQNGRMQSFPRALRDLGKSLADSSLIDTEEKATEAVAKLVSQSTGVVNMYFAATGNSLAYKASQAVKGLYVFLPGVLPEGYAEGLMRHSTIEVVLSLAAMEQLPPGALKAVDALTQTTEQWLRSTAYLNGVPEEKDREEKLSKLLAPLKKVTASAEKIILPNMRRRVLSQMTYNPLAPLFAGTLKGPLLDLDVDFEKDAVAILEKSLTSKAAGQDRPLSERLPYATALSTFAPTEVGAAAIDRAKTALETEVRAAKDARVRENLRILLKTLSN